MPGLRSLRNRLAIIFALIISGAIGTIYLSVTPRLEASLTSQRLNALVADSKRYVQPVADNALSLRRKTKRDAAIRRYSDRAGAEILAYQVGPSGPFSIADSSPNAGVSAANVQDHVFRAIDTKRIVSEVIGTASGRQAIVVRPVIDDDGKVTYALVFATSLSDVQDNVALIRRQVLLSGGIALVIAVLAGYLVARALAARVNRLLAADPRRLRRRARPPGRRVRRHAEPACALGPGAKAVHRVGLA